MDNEKKMKLSMPSVGGSSLLIVFAVLCLTVFALLSLSTVRANSRLADASVASVTDYYAADCQAETILARLRAGELPDGVEETDGVYRYRCPISETQILDVAVNAADFSVLRWQAAPTSVWQNDDSLSVWDGNQLE